MAETFIQSPPDSTGKRVQAKLVNDGTNDIYTPVSMLADGEDPTLRQTVNSAGAAMTTFPTGSPLFDAFQRTVVSETNLMEMYKFFLKDYVGAFHKVETGVATVTRDATFSGMKLTTGTALNDLASYQTHRYFHYRPGNSMDLVWTMKAGDVGKTNLVRQAGWLCDIDGLYTQWEDSSHYFIIKNGNLGTEEKVEQANWNIDNLSGLGGDSNLSGATLDITKNNLWWVSFQFLGAGDAVFGTWVEGKRLPLHRFVHYNQLDRPYLSQGSLPFGFRQYNKGVTGSSSEMHVFCAVITNEGYDEYDRDPVCTGNTITATATTFVPVLSFRPSEVTAVGVINRSRILAQMATLLSETGAAEFKSIANGTLTGDTWALQEDETEIDIAATAITGGKDLMRQVTGSGNATLVDLRDLFLLSKSGITRHFDATTTDHITICARLLTAGSSQVSVALNLTEID